MGFVLPVYHTCLKMDFEYRNVKREIREIEYYILPYGTNIGGSTG